MKHVRFFLTTAVALLLAACGQLQTPQDAGSPLPDLPTLTTAAFSSSSLIVKLAGGLSAAEQQAVLDRHALTETSKVAVLNLHVADIAAGSSVDEVIAALSADPDVVRVEREALRAAEAVPADPAYGDQWALPMIGWDSVYGAVTPSGSVKLALLDTGVDAANPDLSGRLVAGFSAFGTSPTNDPNGHGTALAGIAAAASNDTGIAGVAYAGVSVMSVQVLDAAGLGQDGDIIAGLVWAADNGAKVILMAFSNPGYSPALQDAINYAWSKGAVLVAATGNDGANAATFPAGSAKVVGVSATTATDALWSGSNYGAATFIAAPGVNVLGTARGEGTTTVTGTSASSALVAGAAALMRAADPAASNGVIVGRLARNADAVGTQEQTGNGRLNLARAIADGSTDAVVPGGAAPAQAGPFVGPYVAAAKTLTITFAGTGGGTITFSNFNPSPNPIACTSTCAKTGLDNNQLGTITATANPGSTFAGWSGTWDVSGGTGTTCTGTNSPCTFDMANKAQALTATFTASASTTTTLTRTAGSNPSTYGNSVTFTATVAASPSNPNNVGTATFKDGATTLCASVPLSGNAASCTISTLSVSGSPHSITAEYSGGTGFSSSTSTALAHSVTAKTLTITGVTAANKTYNGNAVATLNVGTAALNGVVSGDSVTLNTGGASGAFADKNVGTGKLVTVSGLTIGGAHASNYTLTQPTTTADITPASLTITASSPSAITYGDAAPTVTPSYAGFVSGDNAGNSLTTAPTCGTTYSAGDPVGAYPTTCSGATATNYTIGYAAGSFTVTPKAASVTPNAAGKTYGAADPTLTGTLSGFLAGDTVTATYSRTAGESVAGSPYIISAVLAPAGVLGNYTITANTANFTIDPRALTVSAAGVNKEYDGTTAATVTLSDDRVSGDVLNTSYTSAAFADKNVGNGKAVSVNGISISGADSGNYSVNTTAATTANITARPITVTADAKTKVYGNADPALTYQVTSGSLASGDSFTGALSRAAGENVGTYAITQGSLALSSNYTLTFVGADLTITVRPITVTADAKTKVYGNADPALTYGITSGSLVSGDSFTGALTRTPGEAVGSYPIQKGTLSAGGNYTPTFVGANLTIGAWTLQGFQQPVGPANTYSITNPSSFMWNTVKGGSTVPLKFNVFAGGMEKTSTTDIKTFTSVTVSCNSSAATGTDPVETELLSTGGTSLRYSGTSGVDGQFIQNWKTSSVTKDTCFRVTLKTQDDSMLVAFFWLRK